MADNLPKDSPLYVEKEVHLLDYFHVIQRRWRIALIVFVLVFVGVACFTFVKTPIYQADVTMRVGFKSENSSLLRLGFEAKSGYAWPTLDSEIEILLSWAVAEKTARELGLDWVIDSPSKGFDLHLRRASVPGDVSLLQLELTGFLPTSTPPESAIEPPPPVARFLLRDAAGRELGTGTSGARFERDDLQLLVDIDSGKIGDRVVLQRIPFEQAVGKVLASAGASEVGQDGFMLGLSVQSADPVEAQDIANAMARAYQQQNAEIKAQQASLMLGFIDEQLAELGRRLDRSEQALQEFTIKTGLKRLSPEGSTLVSTAVDLERRKAELNLQKERLQVFVNSGARGDDFSAVSGIPGVDQYLSRLLELKARRSELLRSYTAAHPTVLALDEEINQTRNAIIGLAEQTMRSLRLQIIDIDQELRESGRRLESVPEEEYELVRLTRANQVNANIYSYLLQRQQEIRITEAATVSDVEIINFAQAPAAPVSPNKRKNLALGLILGAMLGIGLAFLLDYLDRTIKDEDDVQEQLGLPVLGTIPLIREAEESEHRQLVTHLDPMSPSSEAFLALRTNLTYILTNQTHRTVMVTSCLPDEGKSTVTVNLAATLAQTGAKVLLIGCDLRRPGLYRALDQSESPGLTDLLMTDDQAAIRQIKDLNLDFIPAGTEPPNPSQLLNSDKMRELLEKARDQYHYVLLDVPPLLPVADALILASQVDVNLMVVESCRIPEKIAKRALKALQHHGAEIAGAVLNDKTGKGAKYYGAYSYYEGKYYQGYYRREESEPVKPVWKRVLSRVWDFING